MSYYWPHLATSQQESKGRNIWELYGNYGTNWNTVLMPGVEAYKDLPAMAELATFEPIDEVRHVLGITKDQIQLPTSYLGKWIRKFPKYVEIVHQYMEYVVWFPGFKDFLERSDYDPVVKEDPIDKALLGEIEKAEKEAREQEEKVKEIASKTGMDPNIMEAALRLLFPNGLPNAEQLAAFTQLQWMIGATNQL